MGHDLMLGVFHLQGTEYLPGLVGFHQTVMKQLGDPKIRLGHQGMLGIGFDQ